MKLLLVRHGETDWNSKGLMLGATEISLNDAGKEQAQKLSRRLEDDKIDIILSSPLKRAKETAEIVNAHHQAPLHLIEELREKDFGIFEGKKVNEYREAVNKALENGEENFYNYRPPRGESNAEVNKRVMKFLNEILGKYSNKTILIVSHGVVIREILFYFTKLPREDFRKLFHDTTGLSIIEVDEKGKHTVRLINCTKHLG